jgi:penicillin-binding protein 1A
MQHLLANVFILSFVLVTFVRFVWISIPTITAQNFVMPQGVILTDRDNKELYRFYRDDDRIDLPISEFPLSLRNAVIAIEDERFYSRSCIDIRAILRAGVANLSEFKSQGASTITQQLLRTTFDLQEKTFSRKLFELSLACKMESQTDKDDILRLYLNHASFGGSTYGAEKASLAFFGKDVRALSLAESAVLAAVLQRPTYFSPYGNHKRSQLHGEGIRSIRRGKLQNLNDLPAGTWDMGLIGTWYRSGNKSSIFVPGRSDQVLSAMADSGMITEEQYDAAEKELQKMTFVKANYPVTTPYFPAFAEEEAFAVTSVGEDCKLQSRGCTVISTLDSELQHLAEKIVENHSAEIQEKYHANNIAMVVLDKETREIVAYIGNVDFSATESGARMDMAQVPRQPGSSFKPFVYATAFEQGYGPGSFILDAPLTLGGVQPQNYEGGYHGWVSIRHALGGSRNIPAIRTFFMVGGEDPILGLAARIGITAPLYERELMRKQIPTYSYGYPLAIGAAEVPLLQMVQGYATLANNGAYLPVSSVKEVRNAENKTVYQGSTAKPVQVLAPHIAKDLTSILQDNTFRPSEYWKEALTLNGIDSAVKTGTSDQCSEFDVAKNVCIAYLPTDVWTIGYTPSFVVGVWVGNATYEPLAPIADGLNVAAPLWKEFLEQAQTLRPELQAKF